MATSSRRFAAPAISVFLLAAHAAGAADIERIRIESTYLRPVVADAAAHSETFRRLVDEIQRSNVIVYVTCEHFRSATLRGRTRLLSGSHDVRYVRVDVDCMQTTIDVITIVGHELRHVAEIAAAAVVDQRSFLALYKTLGFSTCSVLPAAQFETMEAERAGERVRREYAERSRAH